MAVKRLALLLIGGSLLAGCLQIAPSTPRFVIKYQSDPNSSNADPSTQDPVTTPPANVLPTKEEIEAKPLESGIALYTFYCSGCHRDYEESSKRDIGIDAGKIRDPYVMNFPRHRGRPWPADSYEAYAVEKALAVPFGRDPPQTDGDTSGPSDGTDDGNAPDNTTDLPTIGSGEDDGQAPVLGGN